ncbi:MAG TPA: FkbM family methyltransferase [Thermoanaerobaculia bacterium]|jgi:FkbM family methyltransferase|nr:FkbM family methyltransferase [Thermoanaerobaculia bacterium]
MMPLVRSLAYSLRTRPLLARWALRLIPDVPWTLQVEGIGPFRVRLRRNRSWWLRKPLESESFPFAMLRHLVRPGDVVYDCGANLGLYARFLVSHLGAGRVVAFEPSPENRRFLAANLALGGIADRVTVLPMALADEDGMAEFQVDDMQTSSGTLSRVTGGEPCEGRRNLRLGPLTDQVLCRRLDTVVAEEGLPLPDVIKIDVEGAEPLLLRGAAGILREHRPALVVELHGAEVAREVLTLLHDLGYACAARVSAHLHPGGYGPVDPSVLPQVEGPYDVHFIVAARDPAALPAAWEPAP